ncbi:MAG: hypothetical protein AB1529_02940 [Candidatus Micrarchaeota archaeon]
MRLTNGINDKETRGTTRFEATARRAREFMVAGTLAVAGLIAPGYALAQDGGPSQPPPPRQPAAVQRADGGATASAPTNDQLITTLNALPGDVTAITHPVNAPTMEALSVNLVRLHDIRELLLNPPASGDARRPVYDRAMALYGNNRGTALDAVTRAYSTALHRLHGMVAADENARIETAGLEQRLVRIERGVAMGESNYEALDPVSSEVAELIRAIRGGRITDHPTQQDRAVTNPSLPLIAMLPFDFGSQFFLSGFGNRQFVALDAASTPALNSLFGGESIAQESLNTLASAYAVMMNSPGDLSAQADAARALHSALSRIPSDKEIWNESVHPNFAAAMQALSRGDLRGGLDALRREVAFNAVYDSLGNLHQVTISQRALARIRTSLILRFPEQENITEFQAYRRGTSDRPYAWDVLHYDVGANYAWLLMSGRDQTVSIDPATNQAVSRGPARPVEGDGHAIDLQAGVTWGGSMFSQPVETTLTGRLGYLWWNIDQTVNINGSAERLSVNQGSIYGLLNFDVAMVGYEGRMSSFRLSRWGLGTFNTNPYAYFTLSQRWTEGNALRLETSLTPHYMLFWGKRQELLDDSWFFQHRVGADLRPIDFSIQSGQNWTWYFGPGLRYDLNTEHLIHSFEPYVHASFRYAGGVALDARVGYFMDRFGQEAYHVPDSVTGTLNLVLTPGYWGSSGSVSGGVRLGTDSGERR